RDLLHRGRGPRGRVRPGRRRAPRPARVGLRDLAGSLPARARRLRAAPAGLARAQGAVAAPGGRGRPGVEPPLRLTAREPTTMTAPRGACRRALRGRFPRAGAERISITLPDDSA